LGGYIPKYIKSLKSGKSCAIRIYDISLPSFTRRTIRKMSTKIMELLLHNFFAFLRFFVLGCYIPKYIKSLKSGKSCANQILKFEW